MKDLHEDLAFIVRTARFQREPSWKLSLSGPTGSGRFLVVEATDDPTGLKYFKILPTAIIEPWSIITSFLHAWCHAVFCVLITRVCHGIYISTRRDVALPRVVFTQDVEFTRNRNVTFSHAH